VSGFAGGIQGSYVGRIEADTKYAGVYWTYLANSGFYVDTVVQRSWYGGHAQSTAGNRIGINGTGVLASVEAGYGLHLTPTVTLEPQIQLIAQGVSLRPVAIPAANVIQDGDGSLTGRIGLRLKGDFGGTAGRFQPYLRANLWKGFASTDRTLFVTPAAGTAIVTRNASLWGEGGGGLTLGLGERIALYGEGTYRFNVDKSQGVTGHSVGASVGLRIGF
jgi:outer membrane autotransporter protein